MISTQSFDTSNFRPMPWTSLGNWQPIRCHRPYGLVCDPQIGSFGLPVSWETGSFRWKNILSHCRKSIPISRLPTPISIPNNNNSNEHKKEGDAVYHLPITISVLLAWAVWYAHSASADYLLSASLSRWVSVKWTALFLRSISHPPPSENIQICLYSLYY